LSLPRPECSTTLFQCSRYGSSMNRMKPGCTSSIHDGRGLSSCTGISSIYDVSLTVPWWPGGSKLLGYRAFTTFRSLANQDIFCRHLEIKTLVQLGFNGIRLVLCASLLKGSRSHTSGTTPFYWFTTRIMCKFAEGASLPYFQ
jgi:hypothetical protein